MNLRGTLSPALPLLVVAEPDEAQHLDTELPILITGPGKLAAGLSVLDLLAPLAPGMRPYGLVSLGTAGGLTDGLSGTHVIGSTFQHDLDGLALMALTGIDPNPRFVLGDGPVLATGDRFISSAEERAALASRADLVDMGGYAVVRVAQMLGLPIVVVRDVSDDAGAGAERTWKESVAHSSAQLGAWVESCHGTFPTVSVRQLMD